MVVLVYNRRQSSWSQHRMATIAAFYNIHLFSSELGLDLQNVVKMSRFADSLNWCLEDDEVNSTQQQHERKDRGQREEWGGNFLMTVGWWITNDWHTEILISVSRPRWWYLIICNCYKGVFKYYITLLFFGGGDPPFSHFFTLFSHWDSTDCAMSVLTPLPTFSRPHPPQVWYDISMLPKAYTLPLPIYKKHIL